MASSSSTSKFDVKPLPCGLLCLRLLNNHFDLRLGRDQTNSMGRRSPETRPGFDFLHLILILTSLDDGILRGMPRAWSAASWGYLLFNNLNALATLTDTAQRRQHSHL